MDIEVHKREIFSDPENFGKPVGQKKDVSIKQFYEKDGDRKLDVRKDLQEILNLPLRRYPVSRQDIIVFPGGRKKKNERPTKSSTWSVFSCSGKHMDFALFLNLRRAQEPELLYLPHIIW